MSSCPGQEVRSILSEHGTENKTKMQNCSNHRRQGMGARRIHHAQPRRPHIPPMTTSEPLRVSDSPYILGLCLCLPAKQVEQ